MNHLPQSWGRPRDDVYGAYDASYLQAPQHPAQHTQSPIVTGTSVLALKFKDGVVIAADNLASYGSLARFDNVKRLRVFNQSTVLGFGGDVSDMQFLDRTLAALAVRENYADVGDGSGNAAPASSGGGAKKKPKAKADGSDESDSSSSSSSSDDDEEEDEDDSESSSSSDEDSDSSSSSSSDSDSDAAAALPRFKRVPDTTAAPRLHANNMHTYLTKLLYRRRTAFNPLWNHILVAGLTSTGATYLASVDLLGTSFSAACLATGFGAHLALPLLRRLAPDDAAAAKLPRARAVRAIVDCLRVLFYRDARSLDRFSIAVVERKGVDLAEDEKIKGQSWAFAEVVRGYGAQVN